MIRIEKTEVYGWEVAVRGMRNPMNSWDKSDTVYDDATTVFEIGKQDLKLMEQLAMSGTDDSKFLRMINITMDITAPLYWWKQFDTYKVGTVSNGCSTMHKIHAEEFKLSDFSCEHVLSDYKVGIADQYGDLSEDLVATPKSFLNMIISMLNIFRKEYIETKDKNYWWQMIQLLPSSYNQKRTVQFNYQNAMAMYNARKNHKLDEWRDFCEKLRELPYFKEIFNLEG